MNDLSPIEVHRRLSNGALLIDVREPDEWEAARVPGASHLPLAKVPERMAELPQDRDVILMCHSGGRSGRACAFLAARGFERVFNLGGGILAWAAHGLPLVS